MPAMAFWWLLFNVFQYIQPITLVYNMKIRRVFALPAGLSVDDKPRWIPTAVPILYKRDRHFIDTTRAIDIKEKRLSLGSIFNVRYIPSRAWWAEATTGLEKEHVDAKGTTKLSTSRTGFDDIVLAAGRNLFPSKSTQCVLYGLAGFPTRTKIVAQEAQDTLVGTRFFSAGIGSEFSCGFIENIKHSLVGVFQNRFLHFFERKWDPIIPGGRIEPGNVTDLLFAVKYRRGKNIFDIGYNPTFFTNQAAVFRTGKVHTPGFIRQGAYASFAHAFVTFPIVRTPVIVGTGFLISRAKRFDTKIFSCWATLSMVF